MPPTKRTLDELASLGGDIFDRQVRPALRPEDHGKFVAIDVETGDYELDEDDYAAVARLLSRKPAANIWLMRAGYPTTYKIRTSRESVLLQPAAESFRRGWEEARGGETMPVERLWEGIHVE